MDLWLPPKPAIIIPAPKHLLAPRSDPRLVRRGLTMLASSAFLRSKFAAAAAGITFLNSVIGNQTDGTAITLNLTSLGLAADDIVIISCLNTGDQAPTSGSVSTGYTQLANITGGGGGRDFLWVGYKRMTASPDTSAVLTGTGINSLGMSAVGFGFRGVSATTAIDVTTTTISGNSANPDPPAITPVTNNCCIVIVAGMDALDASPGTVTNFSIPVTATADTVSAATTSMAYQILSGGASTPLNPAAFSSWSTGNWSAATIALRPA